MDFSANQEWNSIIHQRKMCNKVLENEARMSLNMDDINDCKRAVFDVFKTFHERLHSLKMRILS